MMSHWVVVAVLGCAACSSSINYAGLQTSKRHATFHESARSATLPNGLKVAVVPDDRANLVTVLVRYDVGFADDPDGAAGLSHFLEHLLFGKAPGDAGETALEGNAQTGADRTYFYTTAIDSAVDAELELAAHRMEVGCDAFSDEVLARERDVVIEELQQKRMVGDPRGRMLALVWGANHPYANMAAAEQFRSASRATFCKFLAEHYGPGAATLVVVGRVDPGIEQRIAARFAKIASRPGAPRSGLPPLSTADAEVVVAGLERDYAVLAMPFEATPSIAAVVASMGIPVLGEERERLLVLATSVDPGSSQLAERGATLRRRVQELHLEDIDRPRRDARNRMFAGLDDQITVARMISDQLAHGERPNRYRDLEQLDALTPDDVARAVRPGRLILFRGDGTHPKPHPASELGNVVHHVALQHAPDAPVLPTQHAAPSASDYTLSNGMRIVLAPDLAAAGVDARLVIATDQLTPEWREDARQVPSFLRAPAPMTPGDEDNYIWYARFGAPIQSTVRPEATTFAVTGSALFADWDVWSLSNLVVAGDISNEASFLHHRGPLEPDKPALPSATEAMLVVLDELLPNRIDIRSRDRLRAFRAQSYGPRVATLIVSGRFDESAMRHEIEALFGSWRGGPSPTPATYRAQPRTPAAIAITDPDAQQVDLAIAFASTGNYTDRERVTREVLSSLVDDRVRVIREGLGVSYGVGTLVIHTAVLCHGSVDLAYASDAGKAFAEEIAHLRAGQIDPTDFARARNHVLAAKLAQPLGATRRATMLERSVVAKQPLDQDARDLELIRTLDLDAVKALAMRDLQSQKMVTVVRGPAAQIRGVFTALGIPSYEQAKP
ncbi:MAG: insulinase family protein [Kofleriaceae bacterium]